MIPRHSLGIAAAALVAACGNTAPQISNLDLARTAKVGVETTADFMLYDPDGLEDMISLDVDLVGPSGNYHVWATPIAVFGEPKRVEASLAFEMTEPGLHTLSITPEVDGERGNTISGTIEAIE